MTKTYRLSMRHDFVIKTDDIQKVLNGYEFPDFSQVLEDEAEFIDGQNTWTEVTPCDCDQCECTNHDDYTKDNGTCEDCFTVCLNTDQA